ncbi:hypothetical protein GQ600_18688 [Phytophthora cactorum]|nr:hypothetical protein GQ600_18688 [Phytophthora cactorum]
MTIIPHKLQANRYASVVRIITNYDLSETDKLWRDASNIVYNNRPRSIMARSTIDIFGSRAHSGDRTEHEEDHCHDAYAPAEAGVCWSLLAGVR